MIEPYKELPLFYNDKDLKEYALIWLNLYNEVRINRKTLVISPIEPFENPNVSIEEKEIK